MNPSFNYVASSRFLTTTKWRESPASFFFITTALFFSIIMGFLGTMETSKKPFGAEEDTHYNTTNESLIPHNYIFQDSTQKMRQGIVSIPIATTACGLQVNETNVLFRRIRVFLKTLALFNEEPVKVIIIMNDNFYAIDVILRDWPKTYRDRLNITVIPSWFPPDAKSLQYLFKKCAAQKLLFLEMPFFKSTDSLVYYDNDVVFLNSVSSLFAECQTLEESQSMGVFGLSYGMCRPGSIVKKPCFNCGVWFLNLTRIRNYHINVTKAWLDIRKERRLHGDQSLLNIFWTRHRDIYKKLSIQWNFDINGCVTKTEVVSGISAVHGTANSFFHSNQAYDFTSLFNFFENWNMNSSFSHLVEYLEKTLQRVVESNETVLCKVKTEWKNKILYYPRELQIQADIQSKVMN